MKKIIRIFVLALLMLSMLSSVACSGTGNGGGGGASSTITEAEWSSITDTAFVVQTNDYVLLKANQNSYEKYRLSGNSTSFEGTYLNGIYKVTKSGGVWQPMQPVDQTTYASNLQGAKGVINYVKNNQASFAFANNKYTFSGTNEDLIKDVASICYALELNVFTTRTLQVEKVTVQLQNQNKSIIKISAFGESAENENLTILLHSSVLQYDLDKEINRLTTFAIKGGPSLDDIDYIEAYFTENGFRVYNPNNPDPLRRDGYLRYDADENKYYTYRQDAQGNWSMQETSRAIYESTRQETFNLYMGNFLEQSEYLVCDYSSARCYNKQTITRQMSIGEVSYFNISIIIGNTFSLSNGATWNMQIRQGQAYSLVYNIELDVTPFTLDYPQV